MLEEKPDPEMAEEFEFFLALSIPANQASTELRADLRLARNLSRMNLGAESRMQDQFRKHLAQKIQAGRPGIRKPLLLSSRLRLWLSAGIAALTILLLAVNLSVITGLEQPSGWRATAQTRLAPTQVLTSPGDTPTNTRTAGLTPPLFMHDLSQSPTPGVARITPDFPMAVPTPGAKPPQ
jgi:hypothetical protein